MSQKINHKNICRAWERFPKLINVGHLDKTVGPRKKSKIIDFKSINVGPSFTPESRADRSLTLKNLLSVSESEIVT